MRGYLEDLKAGGRPMTDKELADHYKHLYSEVKKQKDELEKENNKLQFNWNSLRELIIKRLDKYDRLVSKEEGIEIETLMWVRDKMNELEGGDK